MSVANCYEWLSINRARPHKMNIISKLDARARKNNKNGVKNATLFLVFLSEMILKIERARGLYIPFILRSLRQK